MARINKSALTKLEIIRASSHEFLENGYTDTTAKKLCSKLNMSTGNLTFYFPTKEHLLAVLIDICGEFQWKMMEKEAQDGVSSVMALCLELTSMAVMCEQDAIAKDFYISAYTSPLCLEIIRRNDAERAKKIFREYCPDWTDTQFAEAEILVSGIEYATLMTTGDSVPLEERIAGALNLILKIFHVPEQTRSLKIRKALAMDYRKIGGQVLQEFKKYVEEVNEQALIELIKG